MTENSVLRDDVFKGQHVLITGGGTGIGLATAHNFGRLGARVTIAARTEETLEHAVGELNAAGVDARWRGLNIRDNDSVTALFDELAAAADLPDILINNAGGQFVSPAIDITPNGFRAVMDLNVQGTWHMLSGYARHLVAKGRPGVVTNIVYQHTGPYANIAHGAAARAAVANLSKSLALEWGPYGIRINMVGPGYIETEAIHQYDDAHTVGAIAHQPIRRFGTPQEIAEAVCFLCSPASAFTTGAYLVVDGGHALTSSPDTT